MNLTARYRSSLYDSADKITPDAYAHRATLASSDPFYPAVHLAPACGLLNDPNGLAFLNGFYYIFYQWHPNAPTHGLKHWGLFKTQDFMSYIDCGLFLSPHTTADNFGIYSGGAVVIDDCLHLFYTANHRDDACDYVRKPSQWHVVVNKQDEIIKREEIVAYSPLYTEHNRDPFPFFKGGKLFILVGAQSLAKKGVVLCYAIDPALTTAETCTEWAMPEALQAAFMLECPAFTVIDGQSVLVVSPQGLKASDKYSFQNIYDVVYLVGDDDGNFSHSAVRMMDLGFDFYAPQLFFDGTRHLMVGWLGQAETVYPSDEKFGWSQMLTLVQEVTFTNGVLKRYPISALANLRQKGENLSRQMTVSDCFDLECRFIEGDFTITLGNGTHSVCFSLTNGEFCLDRTHAQFPVNEAYGTQRFARTAPNRTMHTVRMVVDKSAMEIFINEGEQVFSMRFFIENCDVLEIQKGQFIGQLFALQPITKLKKESLPCC